MVSKPVGGFAVILKWLPLGITSSKTSHICPQVVAVYNLTLQVADMSGDGLTATASAIISIDDINDNAPEFTKDEVPPLPTPSA